jgi:hypothetical protein
MTEPTNGLGASEEVRRTMKALARQMRRQIRGDISGELFAESQPMHSDIVTQQKIYEHWLNRDELNLRDDVMPLLLGVDPEDWPALRDHEPLRSGEDGLWQSVQKAVRDDNVPRVLNRNAPEDLWKLRTNDFYAWVKQAEIAVPAPLQQLMQFMATVGGRETVEETINNTTPIAREQVLGGAVRALAELPEQCRGPDGRVNAEYIHAVLERQSLPWFGLAPPDLSGREIVAIIDRYLNY